MHVGAGASSERRAVMELEVVDRRQVKDVMFKKIGVDVPMLSKSEGFTSDQLPARGLAVSNRFGYTFFAHSRGFSTAKTADLLELAEKLNGKTDGPKTAQGAGTVTVTVPNIRILALSSDELTVGVCAGGNVMFHELANLVHKSDTRPFEVRNVDPHDDTYAKDFSWSPLNSDSYLILTSQGKLLLGRIGSTPECKVEKGVVAASWSADGQHIAYVVDNRQLSITTSDFAKLFQVQLPVQLADDDSESDLHVDAIRWVRPDSIIVGYVRVNSEGEEDEYPLFVLNSQNGNLVQEDSNLLGLVFSQLFPSIDSFVVPSGSGPYMLTDYVKPWEMVIAASRKSIDDHIVLLGWLPEAGREAVYSLDVENEYWLPRIELQESGEDNVILGLAIDRTAAQIKLSDPRDETGDSILPPCPVLICLTLEGKLSFFSLARLDEKFQGREVVTRPSNVPDVTRSVPKASSQLTRSQDTSTASVLFSPTVVEQTKDVPPASEITSTASVPFNSTVVKVEQTEDVPPVSEITSTTASVPFSPTVVKVEKTEDAPPVSEITSTVSVPFSPTVVKVEKTEDVPPVSEITSTAAVPFHPTVVKVEQTKDVLPVSKITSRASVPSSPTVVKVEQTKDVPPASEITVQARILGGQDGKGEPVKQGGTTVRTKDVVDDKDSLFERLTSPSPSFRHGATADLLESSRSGLTPISQEVKKSTNISSSASSMTWRDLTGSENVAKTYPGLFRPFDDEPKSGLVKTAPPQVQWGSQLPAAISSLPVTSSVPVRNFQTGSLPTTSATSTSLGKGLQPGPATASTAAFGSSVRLQLGTNAPPKLTSKQRGTERFTLGSESRTFQEQKPSGRAPGVTDMEAAFIAELEKVREMSEEVDQLMSYIEGRWQKDIFGNPAAFTKETLEKLEQGIHLLSEECKGFRGKLNLVKQDVEDLRDEEMRVDAWRIYVQSLMHQKNDGWHQELWTHQKLHPELEMKRKRVLRADQDLKLQIAELEGHLHNLELAEWQHDSARRRSNKQMRSPGQFLSVQNLYNTVNTQMSVAEELANSLTQQMESLDIRWSSPAKDSKSTANTILKSVGVITDDHHKAQSPFPRQRLSYSPMPKGKSINRSSTDLVQVDEPSVQETTRRRRDSMDAAWVNRGAPTTTIKRVMRSRPSQSFLSSNPSAPTHRPGRHLSSDMPTKEIGSQSRLVRPVQSTRMGPSSATSSFPGPTIEGCVPLPGRTGNSSSAPQWPSSGPEPQQIRPGSTFPFGDSMGSGIHLSSAVPAVSNNLRESLFKWANNAPTVASKASPNASPSTTFSAPSGSFDGAGSGLIANADSVPSRKPASFGTSDGTEGALNSSFAPFTKSNTAGSLDGDGEDMLLSSNSSSFSRGGTSLRHRLGSLYSGENQSEETRTGNREGNQRLDASSSAVSTSLAKGPSTTVPLTGSASTPLLTGPTPSTFMAGPASLPQIMGPITGGVAPKASTSTSISHTLAAQSRKVDNETLKGADSFSRPNSSSNDTSVRNIPSFSKLDPPKVSTSSVESSRSVRGSELNEKPAIRKQADEANATKHQQTNQQVSVSSISRGISVNPFDLNSLGPGSTSSTAPASASSSFSSTTHSISSLPVQTPVSKPVFVSAQGSLTPTGINSPSLKATDAPFSRLSSKPSHSDPPVKTAAPNTAPPDASTEPLSASVAKLEVETPIVNDDLSSMNMGATPVPSVGTPPRTTATSSIISSPSPSTGLFSDRSSNSQAFGASQSSAHRQSSGSPFASSSVSAISTSSPFGQSTLWQSAQQPTQQPTQQPFIFPGSSTTSMISTATISSSPVEINEEDMEEEASSSIATFGGFGGLGLGSSGTAAQMEKTNPFGGSPFGNSQPFQLAAPTGGQLFRPATFSLPAAQSSPQQAGGGGFGSGFGSPGFSQNNLFSDAGKGFGSPPQSTAGGFGQPAQLGPGQQALGSALGAFGQTRQVGFGTPFGGSGMGSSPGGGFANASPGGGFASAATGGGFANAAMGGGFAGAAMGGGFAGAASGGGFAGAASGGGFAGAAMSGGFTGGAGAGGGFGGLTGGGFQSFAGNQQVQSPGFGSGVSHPQASLFTQMRK